MSPRSAPSGSATGAGPRKPQGAPVATSPAFNDLSFWNKKIKPNITSRGGVDPNNDAWLQAIADFGAPAYPKLVLTSDFATPRYVSTSDDPLYHLSQVLPTRSVDVHIPLGATPNSGSDHEMAVWDEDLRIIVGLHGAVFANDAWTVDGFDRYGWDSDGMEKTYSVDDPKNVGHRGAPSAIGCILKSEVDAGVVSHTVKVSLDMTKDEFHFPMSGSEQNKCNSPLHGVCVPEGVIIRLKKSVDVTQQELSPAAQVIAKAAQDYGLVIGDTGNVPMGLKLERDADWASIDVNDHSLASLTWDKWEFVPAGQSR